MKKLLSLVLSLVLMCSMIMLPTNVKADTRVEINATNGGKIEPQEYLSQVEYNDIESTMVNYTSYDQPAAGIYLHSRASSSNPFYEDGTALMLWKLTPKSGENSVTYKVPVTVTDAGWYDLKYKVGGADHKDNMSTMTVTVTDDDVANDTGVLISELHFGNDTVNGMVNKKDVLTRVYMFENHGTRTYFEEGNYTLNITIYKCTQGDIRIILDALRFVPAQAETLTPAVENIFEYEDYNPFNGYSNSSASGGKVLYDSSAKVVDSSANPYIIRIPVKTDSEGEYRWSTVMAYKAQEQSSAMKLYLNGELIADNSKSGVDVSKSNTFVSSTYPMHQYSGTKELPKGEHVFELHITEGTNSAGKLRFAADYLSIQPMVDGALPIFSTQATTIELENYAEDIAKLISTNAIVTEDTSGTYNKITNNSSLSNGGAVYIKNATLPSTQSYVSLEIPVSVSKAGYYDVEFCVGGRSDDLQYVSNIDFEISGGGYRGKIIGTRHIPSSPNATYTKQVSPISGTNVYTHKGNAAYLEEGTYVLKMNIYGSQKDDTTVNLIADYIKLIPTEPKKVDHTKTYFEFEDYDNMLIRDNAKAHGEKVLYDGWMYGTGETFEVCIPMDIQESDYYSWEAVMTKRGGGHVSALTLFVDGEQVVTNTSSGVNISDTDGDGTADFISSDFPMYRYESSEMIYLEKGYHELTLMAGITNNDVYKYGADYFAIQKYIEPLTATAKENSTGDGFDVTFNYATKTDTLSKTSVIIKNAEGTEVDYAASLSADGLVYSVKPAGGLTSEFYTVTVKKGVVGALGNVVSEDITLPVMIGVAGYATATVEYDIYMGGDAPFDSTTTFVCNVNQGNLIATAQGMATIGTTQVPITATEGWHHVKADISYPKKMATITLTLPNGTVTRGAYEYIYFSNATKFTDIIIEADSNYLKNVKLYETSGDVRTVTGSTQTTYEGIFNLVTTFYGDEKTTRGFAWSATSDHTDMVIRYAKADADWNTSYTQKAAEYESYDGQLYYKVDISGLEAGTKYVYTVGDPVDNVWTEKYEIETEKEDNHDFSFIAMTDPQGASASNYTYFTQALDAAIEDAPDAKFILELGDLVDTGYNEEQWKMYFNASQNYTATLPHMAIVGNHETRDDGTGTLVSGKHFSLHFNNPKNGGKAAIGDLTPEKSARVDTQGVIANIEESIYSFDYGDVHFVALNSGSDFYAYDETVMLLEAQKKWIKQDIEASDKKWTIVMMHQGLYPAKEERYFGAREVLEDLFVECGVDLVLQGHDHMVSRTYPMKSSSIQTRENADVITEDSGIVYYIPGAAANKRYEALTSSPAYMNKIINTSSAQPTYSLFNVTEDKIEVVTKQLNGEILDTFSIVEKPEITLTEDTAQKTVTAKSEYTKTVSGTEIAAFYKDDVLIKAVIGDELTNAQVAEVTAENLSQADFDEVKIFIWDIRTLRPYTAARSLRLK